MPRAGSEKYQLIPSSSEDEDEKYTSALDQFSEKEKAELYKILLYN